MDVQDFPIPEVAKALAPYIRPREEVHQIRRELQNHLSAHVGHDQQTLTTSILPVVRLADSDTVPASLSGVHKAYWRALQAHHVAQARYDELHADIVSLQSSSGLTTTKQHSPSLVNEGHVPILRLREKQRMVNVLAEHLAQVDDLGNGSFDLGLDEIVRRRVGEQPPPPTHEAPELSTKAGIDAKLLALKKAVLTAEHDLRQQRERQSLRKGVASSVPLEAEIAGLQNALQEITGWMEEQLAVIGDVESSTSQSEHNTSVTQNGSITPTSVIDIAQLYEHYLVARQRLLVTAQSPRSTTKTEIFASSQNGSEARKETGLQASAAEVAYGCLSTLRALKEDEASLLQQSSFSKSQFAAAESHAADLMGRLADESRLVQSGATEVQVWADAARQDTIKTTAAVLQRLATGEDFAAEAEKGLKSIKTLREMLASV